MSYENPGTHYSDIRALNREEKQKRDQRNAKALRAEASKHFDNERESFERCDTDGFVSQWASGLMGSLKSLQADIAENDGKAWLPALVDASGRLVKAKMIFGQYGPVWLLDDAGEAKYGRKFVPMGLRSRVQKKLGLHEDQRKLPAYAYLRGNGGSGLGNACSVRPVVVADYKALGWDW